MNTLWTGYRSDERPRLLIWLVIMTTSGV